MKHRIPSFFIILALVVLIAALALVFWLISGAVSIISGAFEAILCIVIILALVLIVLWMFSYSKKHRK